MRKIKNICVYLGLFTALMGHSFVCATELHGGAPVETHTHNEIDFIAWNETTFLPTEQGNYYLTDDVNLTTYWTVPIGTTNLCLNGHVIEQTNGESCVIYIGSTFSNMSVLNLYDCSNTLHEGSHEVGGLWKNVPTGMSTNENDVIFGGIITGGRDSGVYIDGIHSEFNLYGGNIAGNVGFYGGGVFVSQGSFTMYGGTIRSNNANNGAGVSNCDSMTMIGGRIYSNYLGNKSDLIQSFTGVGGGIQNCGNLTIGGSAVVENNFDPVFANNLDCEIGKTILISNINRPIEGMRVGISGEETVIKNAQNGDDKYFFSDDRSYFPVVVIDQIILALHYHSPVEIEGKDPLCELGGYKKYYSCKCGDFYEDEDCTVLITNVDYWKEENGRGYIPPLGHDYDEPTFVWSEDNTACTASEVCKNCGFTYKAEAVVTIEDGYIVARFNHISFDEQRIKLPEPEIEEKNNAWIIAVGITIGTIVVGGLITFVSIKISKKKKENNI